MKRTKKGGGAERKRGKRNLKFAHSAKHSHLFSNPDEISRGFLASCETHAIARGVQELSDLLNKFSAEFHGPIPEDSPKKRFVVYDSGVAGLIAVKLQDDKISPVDFAERVFNRVSEMTAASEPVEIRTTSLTKVVPVELFCSASISAIKERAAPIISTSRHLGPESPATTFAVVFRSRNNVSLDRSEAITTIAGLVDPKHKVDLDSPHVTIICEVFKSAAAISVLTSWDRFRKFNLREVIKTATPTTAVAATAVAPQPIEAKPEKPEETLKK